MEGLPGAGEFEARISKVYQKFRDNLSTIVKASVIWKIADAVDDIMTRHIIFYTLNLLLLALPLTWALKFDLAAHTGYGAKYERCIRNFVARDTLVLVTAIVDGSKGDGQMVNMHVSLQGSGPSNDLS